MTELELAAKVPQIVVAPAVRVEIIATWFRTIPSEPVLITGSMSEYWNTVPETLVSLIRAVTYPGGVTDTCKSGS
jgi:hypothetical protein